MEFQEIKSVIEKQLSSIPEVISVYLLGSAKNGNMRIESDLDLGLLLYPKTEIDAKAIYSLQSTLGFETGIPADIGIVSSKDLIYSKEAIYFGERIFTRDKGLSESIETTLFSMYVDFSEQIKEIKDAYRA
ncbi:MAG: nucleotidyltransferase domain-containing protein [Spirochaetia bacterium]